MRRPSDTAIDRAREWYEAYGYALQRRCLALLRDSAAADDALQEVFLRALRYGDSCRDSPLPWLKRIADRCCFDQMRRRRRRAELHEAVEAELELSDWPAHDPDKLRLLSQLLGRAKPKLRQVAVLFYLDEMTQEEIARQLDCSTMTVKRRLAAFRQLAARNVKES